MIITILILGFLFGAILGYYPGALAISLNEGSIDALISIIGGLFGARMAGGCTSGHILSGGMQFAFSN